MQDQLLALCPCSLIRATCIMAGVDVHAAGSLQTAQVIYCIEFFEESLPVLPTSFNQDL